MDATSRDRRSPLPHLPEYLCEALGLGLFMVSVGVFATLLGHPSSPVRAAIPSELARRVLMGCAMGATAIGLVYSPWGRRSGSHNNPALTLTFLRLGKIAPGDALGYVTGQFVGGALGLFAISALLRQLPADPAIRYAATVPGPFGVAAAFAAESAISFLLLLLVLTASNSPRASRFTGLLAGAAVATFITVEAPVSGMSMNPARTFASALAAGEWTSLWVYFTAPPMGMLLAAEAYVRLRGARWVHCAKLVHDDRHRCIFRCRYGELVAGAGPAAGSGPPRSGNLQRSVASQAPP